MAVTLSPATDLPLILAQEHEVSQIATVTAASDLPEDPVTEVTWSAPEPLPPQCTVVVAVPSLTLTVPHFADLFPIREIRFLRAGEIASCTRWVDLPADAEDVVAYRPDTRSMRDFAFRVAAKTQSGLTAAADYVIRVYANYSLGRDTMQEAIDARR